MKTVTPVTTAALLSNLPSQGPLAQATNPARPPTVALATATFLFVAATLLGALDAPAQCTNVWLPVNGASGVNDFVRATSTWDPDGAGPATPVLVMAGSFTQVGPVLANRIATWDPATITCAALGSGMDGVVHGLTTLPNGDLVAGGAFTTAGGVSANNIARWNGTSWSALGSGMSGVVYSLTTLSNGDLVAGGLFPTAGGVSANNIARWNGTSWSALGSGMSSVVYGLTTLPNGDLVAGGGFSTAGGVSASRIARWNGTSWSALGSGMNGNVQAFTMLRNGDLVAAGGFSTAGGVSASRIARWNGTSWAALGSGTSGVVNALTTLPNGDLVAGGAFTTAGGGSASYIARWNGTSWSALGSGMDYIVIALSTLPNGDLVAGGAFTTAGGVSAAYIARLTTTCPAVAVSYGAGGTGSGGLNVLAATTLPWIGSTFRATATGMPSLAFVLAVTGFTQESIPLAALLPQGVPGNDLLVSPDLIDVMLPSGGMAQSQLALPNSLALVGQQFYHQILPIEVDLSLAFLAITSTNAFALTIGAF